MGFKFEEVQLNEVESEAFDWFDASAGAVGLLRLALSNLALALSRTCT
jgi:hypothetical protein